MNSFPSSISTSDSIGTSCADKDIALFGLSGNPPTGESGHAGIVRYLVQSGRFHEVWVLPVFRHQFSSKSSLSSFENRVELCQMAFEGYTTESCVVRVLTLERDVEEVVKRHGTVDTLNYIREKCLEARLHLILGADTYNDIAMGKWKQGES
jgi:nicotinic acid mononucleotide adenylyltransferase